MISICIAKSHNRIRATSSNKLLQACYKLANAWHAYTFTRLLQACDKPTTSCFAQVAFEKLKCQVGNEQKRMIYCNIFDFLGGKVGQADEAYLS